MAKRSTAINRSYQKGPHKTKKRLEIKRDRLIELAKKKRKHNRVPRSIKSIVK